MGVCLTTIEKELYKGIGNALASNNPGRDRGKCDAIFGIYTHAFLKPCNQAGLTSRAAVVGSTLIHRTLEWEKKLSTEFHKGALFADTALAHFLCGNEDEYEYLLAMADEEDFKTSGGSHKRGTLNLRANDLTRQTFPDRLKLACELLNYFRNPI